MDSVGHKDTVAPTPKTTPTPASTFSRILEVPEKLGQRNHAQIHLN